MLFFRKKQSPKPNESPKTEDPFEKLARSNKEMNEIIAETAQKTGEEIIFGLKKSPEFKELMNELENETTTDESPSVAGFSSENPTIPDSLEELLGMPSAGTPPTTTAGNGKNAIPESLEELLESFPQGPSGHEEGITSDTKNTERSGYCKNKTSPEQLAFFEQASKASKGRTPAEQEWLDRLEKARKAFGKGKGKGDEGTIPER